MLHGQASTATARKAACKVAKVLGIRGASRDRCRGRRRGRQDPIFRRILAFERRDRCRGRRRGRPYCGPGPQLRFLVAIDAEDVVAGVRSAALCSAPESARDPRGESRSMPRTSSRASVSTDEGRATVLATSRSMPRTSSWASRRACALLRPAASFDTGELATEFDELVSDQVAAVGGIFEPILERSELGTRSL